MIFNFRGEHYTSHTPRAVCPSHTSNIQVCPHTLSPVASAAPQSTLEFYARDKSEIYRRIKTTHGTSPRRRGARPPQWAAPSAIATAPRQSRLAPTQLEVAQQRGDRRTPHQLRPETTLPQQSYYRPAHSLFTLRIAHSSESRHVPARFLENPSLHPFKIALQHPTRHNTTQQTSIAHNTSAVI